MSSNFEEYIFQPPIPVEAEPGMVKKFIELVEDRIPIPLSMVPEDVLEMSFDRIANKNQRIRITAYNGQDEMGADSRKFEGYEVTVIEEYFNHNLDESTLNYRERVVDIDAGSLDVSIVSSTEFGFDYEGNPVITNEDIEEQTNDGSITTFELADLAMIIEKIPSMRVGSANK